MAYMVQVCGTWAGSEGGWRPGISGTLNQTGRTDEDASTFGTEAEAGAILESLIQPIVDASLENGTQTNAVFRITQVSDPATPSTPVMARRSAMPKKPTEE